MCVSVLSTSDGKRPGSSSSFGTRGNMTQMDAISPNSQGPAAQETYIYTQLTVIEQTETCNVLCFYDVVVYTYEIMSKVWVASNLLALASLTV